MPPPPPWYAYIGTVLFGSAAAGGAATPIIFNYLVATGHPGVYKTTTKPDGTVEVAYEFNGNGNGEGDAGVEEMMVGAIDVEGGGEASTDDTVQTMGKVPAAVLRDWNAAVASASRYGPTNEGVVANER